MNSIHDWEIKTVYLTFPDGRLEVMGEGDYYGREDFLSHVNQLNLGKFYLFGFNRDQLCRVDKIDDGEIWLTQIFDLDDYGVELQSADNNKYLLTVA